MYTTCFSSENVTILIPVFALAWFLTGIVIGSRLSRVKSWGRRSLFSRKRNGNNQIEIYVGNLSYDVREKDLVKVFESFGKVSSVRIIKNRFSGKSKGFGFLKMVDRSQSGAAIRALNGRELKGRKILVNEARSRARDR